MLTMVAYTVCVSGIKDKELSLDSVFLFVGVVVILMQM